MLKDIHSLFLKQIWFFFRSCRSTNIDDLIRRVESTVERALRYFAVNGLKVNVQRTQILFVGYRSYVERLPINLKIRVGSSLVSPSEVVKNLGISMDNYLSFDKQVDHLCSKANGLLYLLNRQKEFLDKKSRICVVEALIDNIFSYCSIIWGVCSKTSIAKIQNVQNVAAKVADGIGRKYDRATPFIRKLGWLKISEKVLYDTLNFVFKIIHNKIPN